mmetsp:Transcript_32335/g.53500  ORF Transcript_32335/g.53500 Transcript_32335/m.53500 type:complete len:279 (+) Transcript_32335:8-844(+)
MLSAAPTALLLSPAWPKRYDVFVGMVSTLAVDSNFELAVDLGEGNGIVQNLRFEPYFSSSQLLTFRFAVPFALEAEPCQGVFKVVESGNGLLAGDVLRAFSTIQMRYDSRRKEYRYGPGICPTCGVGPARGRPGGMELIKERPARKCLYKSDGRPHQEVMDALLANTADKTREIVMLFEREITSNLPGDTTLSEETTSLAGRSSDEIPGQRSEPASVEPLSTLLQGALASRQAQRASSKAQRHKNADGRIPARRRRPNRQIRKLGSRASNETRPALSS